MLWCVYPTDEVSAREMVFDQAQKYGGNVLFTSLHIPESEGLKAYVDYLREKHEKGFTFFADIAPLTLKRLDISVDDLRDLRQAGIVGLRIDFGFSHAEIKRIAESGLRIAVNASCVTEADIEALALPDLAGWHNYYPRPETGLSRDFFLAQSALFKERGLPLYSFIPGERQFRAPLFMGLPMLETQRYKNAYRNFLEIAYLSPESAVVCAEGTLYEEHASWIQQYEQEGVLTVPLASVDGALKKTLFDREFTVRPELTGISLRLEGTRGVVKPEKALQGETRARGSIQMDGALWGRYEGELHLMQKDMPLDPRSIRVAEIPDPYKAIAGFIRPRQKIRFHSVL
ncbi:MAG: MupG family TIM beta-alpha barrel fold protein [Spirochaetaceae bacterium]|jgi:hypothetical protein|nr:MupG family TIM beta-alpha barrel fold protein [Spirochaetaceae bacterium]